MLLRFAAILFLSVVSIWAQVPAASKAAFEAADVHASAPSPNAFQRSVVRGTRYEIRNATMLDLILIAYTTDGEKMLGRAAWSVDRTGKVTGGPSWLDSDRFDITAKVPPSSTPESVKPMLRTLLAERFNLAVHDDKKPRQAYALLLAGPRHRLKATDGTGKSGCQYQGDDSQPDVVTSLEYSCHNLTMTALAEGLRGMAPDYLGSPVVDMTGLQGTWDFNLKWSPRAMLATAGANSISITDAINKQLGLKLELRDVPLPVIAIDHVNRKPTDNPPGVAEALPAGPTKFEVAVIKPSMPGTTQQGGGMKPGGRVDVRGITLKDLIMFSWDLTPEMLVGGPKWLDTDRFDILATAPSTGPDASQALGIDELRPLLRALLIERFGLAVHNEEQPAPVYALTPGKRESKLKKADPSNAPDCKWTPPEPGGPKTMLTSVWTCQNVTMAVFAEKLRRMAPAYIDHPIVDATGFDGAWDFTIRWTPRPQLPLRSAQTADQPIDPDGGLTPFEAVDRQLGLKLESQKRPMPVLVIDHVDQKPTEN